jgi:hypothetical protein
MTTSDQKWNMKYEKLVEYKRTNGHCMVPRKYEADKSLGPWVNKQRTLHKNNNNIRPDRKRLLDEIGFAWKGDGGNNYDDKLWHEQYEKLLEHKRINGHRKVPKHKDDKSLAQWVRYQRTIHNNNKMLPDRKELLDDIDFVWKADTLAASSSANDVRGRIIGSFHVLGRCHISHSRSFSAYLCRILIQKLSQAVPRVSQTKHHQ